LPLTDAELGVPLISAVVARPEHVLLVSLV
jgi:hypothetical protein